MRRNKANFSNPIHAKLSNQIQRKLVMSSYTSMAFVAILLFSLMNRSAALIKLPANVTIPALIVFGDSIMDTGNNNDLKTLVKCDFPPYGKDFKAEKPTGRFGNGKVPSDMIAEAFGLEEYLPAYLDPNVKPKDLVKGVCFASGGSGYDPMTSQIVAVLSMDDQLKMFKEYIAKLRATVGKERAKFIIENAVYLVVAGSDDIANTYFTIPIRKLQYDVPAYTDLMVKGAVDFVKEIHALGARRIGLFSAPPIGCVPSQRTLGGGLLRECAEEYNEASILFNSKLFTKLKALTPKLQHSRLVYVDIYNPLLDLIVNHQKYGFSYADKGCCGTGVIEVAVLCNPLSKPCDDPDSHIFWDSYHPSQAAFKLLVPELLQKYIKDFFE